MPPQIATLAFIVGILVLFLLNRDSQVRTSPALWIPVAWFLIAGSRPVSAWMAGTQQQSVSQYMEGSPLDRNVYLTLLVMGIVVLFRRMGKVWPLLRDNRSLLLFLFYCSVSIAWAEYTDIAFKRWIKFLGDFVMVLVVVTESHPLIAMKRFLSRAGLVLLPVSVLFIKYYPNLGRSYSPWSGKQFFTGVGDNKNGLGVISLILGIAALWQFLEHFQNQPKASSKKPLIAQGVLLLIALWLMWTANSMTSMSCFFMAAFLMIAAKLRIMSRMRWAMPALIAGMLFASFSVLFLDVGGDVVETIGRDPTLTGRTQIWTLVLGMRGNPLVGTGFESFWLGKRLARMWSLYWWHPNEAHNGYLEVFLTLGWIGIALLAAVLVMAYRKVMDAFRHDPMTGRLIVAYFVVAVAYNFTESAIKPLSPIWITLLLAITAASIIRRREAHDSAENDYGPTEPRSQVGDHLVGVSAS